MRRTPLKRGTKRLKARTGTDQDRAEYRAARSECRYIVLNRDPWCVAPGCTSPSGEVHEPLLRSRGGDPLDPTQCVGLCSACHRKVHANPTWATSVGLMRSATY